MNDIYEKTMLVIFVVALLIVVYAFYDTWYVFDHASDKSYLAYKPNKVNAGSIAAESPITEDMVAWITMDDTNIDYPIMQGIDNTVYLNLDPYGNYSLAGSIFLDSRNAADFTDPYSIIYGHHMEYGVMFGALDDYLDEAYLNSHKHGELLIGRTGSKSYDLDVFYAVLVDAKDEYVFDPDKYEELYTFLEAQEVDTSKKILCLSTCAGDASTTRTVVFAYIIEN
ncbi:MAG: class B sortase [Clostridiales bacterium]|nr:class B sortase [Clostridiales bacterium]